MALSKGFRVLEKSKPPAFSVLLEHRNKSESILFESQTVAVLCSQEAEAVRKQYVKIADAYGVLGVLQLNAGDSSVLYLVIVTGCQSIGKISDSEIFRITETRFVSLQFQQPSENRIGEVQKLLNSGTFYFAWNIQTAIESGARFDLTLCAQKNNRFKRNETDNRFFWNRTLYVHMLRYGVDCEAWLLKIVCGSVEMRTVYAGVRQARAAIISRLSCERAGTRFNVRGVNDDGHVANFVETEQVIYLDNKVSSYVQTRGSVPLFWEQPGVQVGSHKVRMSRGYEAARHAFSRHMATLKSIYGRQVIVNLLGTSLIGSKEGEASLSVEFQRHHKESSHSDVPHIVFDYHQECRGGNTASLAKLKQRLDAYLKDYGFFMVDGEKIHRQQSGTIRTNCLDCLDRTNCVQTFIGLDVLMEQVDTLGFADQKQIFSRFEEAFRQMWINNGNEVSKIYAGTGAIQGGSKLMDGARSAARTIQNNLLDSSKQEAIDILLVGSTLSSELADRARTLLPASLLHAPSPVLRELCRRYTEFVKPEKLRVAVGTYNVNGGKHFRSVVYKDLSLSDWLLDSHKTIVDVDKSHSIDIFAVGFQEIVDLNASNIVSASTDNAKQWAEELQRVLCLGEQKYCLLTSQQLVGVCLYVFVKPEHTRYIRDLAVDSVKTGLGGATGNKGGVAIRFVFRASSLCFICSHFAAGQNQVAERNDDFAEITRKVCFPMGRTLNSHDYVFWCGDFNYRVDMDKDEIKSCVRENDLQPILECDQLRKEQTAGNVFRGFKEADITFPPTYKYDLFSDDYDTSEKCRAPAWTDRVLWKRRGIISTPDEDDWNAGVCVYYGRTELKQSDHRPVLAIIDVEVFELDQERRQAVINDVINEMGPPDATVIITAAEESTPHDDDDASIFDDEIMTAVIQEFAALGETTLVRFVGDSMWVTFRDGQAALAAVRQQTFHVNGLTLHARLKTDDWIAAFENEIALCRGNTVPLCAIAPPSPAPKRPPNPMRPQRPPKPMAANNDSAPPPTPPPRESEPPKTAAPELPPGRVYEEINEDCQPKIPARPPVLPPRPVAAAAATPPVSASPAKSAANAPPPPLPTSARPTQAAPPPLPPRQKQ